MLEKQGVAGGGGAVVMKTIIWEEFGAVHVNDQFLSLMRNSR